MGSESFHQLCDALAGPQGSCITISNDLQDSLLSASGRLVEVKCLALKDRLSRVWIGCATAESWLRRRHQCLDRGYDCYRSPVGRRIWILNPDTEPEPGALRALVDRSVEGNKGLVGSTIVPFVNRNYAYCRGGLHWRKLRTSLALTGFGEPVNEPSICRRSRPLRLHPRWIDVCHASMSRKSV